MEQLFKAWKTSRQLTSVFFEKYTLAQLNTIPQGFNNNLIWHIGHIIVAQQSLVYKGAGLPMSISEELFHLYKPGTKPEAFVTQSEADELQHLLTAYIASTESDWQNGVFTAYQERTTGTGFHLASVEDALVFNNYHEGMHLGMMMSIRKFV